MINKIVCWNKIDSNGKLTWNCLYLINEISDMKFNYLDLCSDTAIWCSLLNVIKWNRSLWNNLFSYWFYVKKHFFSMHNMIFLKSYIAWIKKTLLNRVEFYRFYVLSMQLWTSPSLVEQEYTKETSAKIYLKDLLNGQKDWL